LPRGHIFSASNSTQDTIVGDACRVLLIGYPHEGLNSAYTTSSNLLEAVLDRKTGCPTRGWARTECLQQQCAMSV